MPHSAKDSGLNFLWLMTLAVGVAACTSEVDSRRDQALTAAEGILDAFYSWQPQKLNQKLSQEMSSELSKEDRDRVLYYQAWAEAGSYEVQQRGRCTGSTDSTGNAQAENIGTILEVTCAVTVTDDLGAAMGYVATDTFVFGFKANSNDAYRLRSLRFEGDDPPVFMTVLDWLGRTKPEVMSGPCRAMFNGGTQPAECARAVVQGANEYMQLQQAK